MPETLDLNLLRVFDALVDTGSITAAAARLNLSVPAASRAVGRLRRAVNDPILVRAGRDTALTPYAQRSIAQVRMLLDGAAQLVADPAGSRPATWRRTFTIRINDGLAPVLAPRLIQAVSAAAPQLVLRFVGQSDKEPGALRDGTLDLDIGVAGPAASDIVCRELFTDHFVAVVAAASPLGRGAHLTVDELCDHPHISASRLGRTRGPLDEALERIGRSRRVVATVPSYAVAGLLALENAFVCLLPRVLAHHLVERGVPVRWHEVPLPMPSAVVEMRWHQRLAGDAQTRWLSEHVTAVVAAVLAGLEPAG